MIFTKIIEFELEYKKWGFFNSIFKPLSVVHVSTFLMIEWRLQITKTSYKRRLGDVIKSKNKVILFIQFFGFLPIILWWWWFERQISSFSFFFCCFIVKLNFCKSQICTILLRRRFQDISSLSLHFLLCEMVEKSKNNGMETQIWSEKGQMTVKFHTNNGSYHVTWNLMSTFNIYVFIYVWTSFSLKVNPPYLLPFSFFYVYKS